MFVIVKGTICIQRENESLRNGNTLTKNSAFFMFFCETLFILYWKLLLKKVLWDILNKNVAHRLTESDIIGIVALVE